MKLINHIIRRRGIAEEENALISLARDNDYGYIPPGYGLNDHLKATMASITGPCSCLQHESHTDSYTPIQPTYDPAAIAKQRVCCTKLIAFIVNIHQVGNEPLFTDESYRRVKHKITCRLY